MAELKVRVSITDEDGIVLDIFTVIHEALTIAMVSNDIRDHIENRFTVEEDDEC